MFLKLFSGIFRFIVIMAVIFGTVAMGGYVAFLTYQTVFYIPNVNVPSVLDMEIKDAHDILNKAGLKMEIIDEPLFSEGGNLYVVSQNPFPGKEIKKNRSVAVEVRTSIAANQIPNLIGKTVQEAEFLLSETGYQIGSIAYSMHHQLSQGMIIAQTPGPGEQIEKNGRINILVSKGLY
ncbi:MAG: PASTA domain-containing protein [Candidatus Caldatribacteriota bacterium]|jgi:serine/threonine-protein kinase|nr:PASTA domain-containing protein [Atribacterota bacterium]MDD3640537.1 PASTA domain-containing protein [Atribacterota bacterium]MDD4764729.1 PASTA domain-containing protein [Atribacterota bacterium]MDI9597339.1 PASTA domain-containing protein [Atribacterota bacterium]